VLIAEAAPNLAVFQILNRAATATEKGIGDDSDEIRRSLDS
jgi:hypothetical protein